MPAFTLDQLQTAQMSIAFTVKRTKQKCAPAFVAAAACEEEEDGKKEEEGERQVTRWRAASSEEAAV